MRDRISLRRRASPALSALLINVLVPVFFLALPTPTTLTAHGLSIPLAGRLVGGATQVGTGLLIPCEDETLTYLDAQGKKIASWTPYERFAGWVSLGKDGICVIPLLSGKVTALELDAKRITVLAQTSRPSTPAFSPVAGDAGRWLLGWRDGWVAVWSPKASFKIDVPLGSQPLAALYDPEEGFWIRTPHSLILVRIDGSLTRWGGLDPDKKVPSSPQGWFLVQDQQGILWSGGPNGLSVFNPATGKYRQVEASDPILGLTLGADDGPVVLEAKRVLTLDADGSVRGTLNLPSKGEAGPILDNRGGLYIYTERGLLLARGSRLLAFWPDPYGGTAPLLTSDGTLVWVGADWQLRTLTHRAPPYLSWSQPGSDPEHSGSSHRPASYASLLRVWKADPSYQVFEALLAHGTRSAQNSVLTTLERQASRGDLRARWPFVNVILLQIARAGVSDVNLDQGRIQNNWPDLRLRAYQLLARTAEPEDKKVLYSLLQREYEPMVQDEGLLALAHSGLDPDGRVTQLFIQLQQNRPEDAVLAKTLLEAAQHLWEVSGPEAPPELGNLVEKLYTGAYPKVLRVEAEKLFQKMLGTP